MLERLLSQALAPLLLLARRLIPSATRLLLPSTTAPCPAAWVALFLHLHHLQQPTTRLHLRQQHLNTRLFTHLHPKKLEKLPLKRVICWKLSKKTRMAGGWLVKMVLRVGCPATIWKNTCLLLSAQLLHLLLLLQEEPLLLCLHLPTMLPESLLLCKHKPPLLHPVCLPGNKN